MSGKSLKRSFLSVAMAKYFNLLIGVGFSAVMARILSPDDFGIFAVVNVIASFFMTVSDFGFGAGIIQNTELTRSDLDGIFTFMILVGTAFGGIMALLGIPLGLFYKNSVYCRVCPMLSIAVLFTALNIVPNAVMLREKRYEQIAVRNVLVSLLSLAAALLMAFRGFKYYALVGQAIAVHLIHFVWNEATVRVKLVRRFQNSIQSVKIISSYSAFQFLSDAAYYAELNADNFLIGISMGSTRLAYYDKAYRLLDYPVGNLAGTLNTVLHPMLSDYQNEKNEMLKKHLYIQKVFSLISIVLVTGCFVCSEEIIELMFGTQWSMAVMTFSIMSFAMYPKMLLSMVNIVFSSLGDTRLLFRIQTKRLAVTVTSVLAGVLAGSIEAVALAIVISSWLNFVSVSVILLRKGFGASVKNVFRKYVPDIVFMTAATVLLWILFHFVISPMSGIWSLTVKGVCVLALYLCYYLITGNIKVLLTLVPVKIRNCREK